jgi:hypothetical protein
LGRDRESQACTCRCHNTIRLLHRRLSHTTLSVEVSIVPSTRQVHQHSAVLCAAMLLSGAAQRELLGSRGGLKHCHSVLPSVDASINRLQHRPRPFTARPRPGTRLHNSAPLAAINPLQIAGPLDPRQLAAGVAGGHRCLHPAGQGYSHPPICDVAVCASHSICNQRPDSCFNTTQTRILPLCV